MIVGPGNMSYEDRLKRTELTKLEEKRERREPIETFEIVKGLNDVDYEFFSRYQFIIKPEGIH